MEKSTKRWIYSKIIINFISLRFHLKTVDYIRGLKYFSRSILPK